MILCFGMCGYEGLIQALHLPIIDIGGFPFGKSFVYFKMYCFPHVYANFCYNLKISYTVCIEICSGEEFLNFFVCDTQLITILQLF